MLITSLHPLNFNSVQQHQSSFPFSATVTYCSSSSWLGWTLQSSFAGWLSCIATSHCYILTLEVKTVILQCEVHNILAQVNILYHWPTGAQCSSVV